MQAEFCGCWRISQQPGAKEPVSLVYLMKDGAMEDSDTASHGLLSSNSREHAGGRELFQLGVTKVVFRLTQIML